MKNMFIELALEDIDIEGILYPKPHLGKTDIIWWYTGKGSERVERHSCDGVLCSKATNFSLNTDGFKLES